MTAGFDSGGRGPRDGEVGVVLGRAGDRVANVRRRLLSGDYDSDYVVLEVARCMLACGVLAEQRETATPQRHY